MTINDTLLDAADRAYRAGALDWRDVQAVQESLMPDCQHCGAAHAGRVRVEGTPLCASCLAIEFGRRKAALLEARHAS